MKNHPLYDTFIQYGFTAQDIQAQFPDFVYDFKIAEKSYLGYDDRKLIPILIKAFQEQHAEISELKTTISTLQSQLESLKTSVDKLTQKV
jgi:peptidoglycan hydrolase CwlO-like protein